MSRRRSGILPAAGRFAARGALPGEDVKAALCKTEKRNLRCVDIEFPRIYNGIRGAPGERKGLFGA